MVIEFGYIRIGEIPSSGRSGIFRSGIRIGKEVGVSVYNGVKIDGKWSIVMPSPMKEGQGDTYECLIQEVTECRYPIKYSRRVYLVKGEPVGKGSDGEPLLKNVEIMDDITDHFKIPSKGCLIRKNTKELREKVEDLGVINYANPKFDFQAFRKVNIEEITYLRFINNYLDCVPKSDFMDVLKKDDLIDCGEDEELFISIIKNYKEIH